MNHIAPWQILTLIAILCGSGVMSGLSGFGFSAVGSLSLLILPPKLAVPLLMSLSTANQLMSLGQLRLDMPKSIKDFWPAGPGPCILGGIVGVPVGVWLLNSLPTKSLMFAFGGLLALYSVYSLCKPMGLKLQGWDSAGVGIGVGVLGGVIGGFTAFPGSAVVVWMGLRSLPKQQTRSVVQPFILCMQVLSLLTTAILHGEIFGRTFWTLLAWTMPAVLPGTIAGVWMYRRVSDVDFRRVTFVLLGLSGVGLVLKAIS